MYCIIDVPYEKCFDYFFKPELGYPNFYRINELLPAPQPLYLHFTLLVPSSLSFLGAHKKIEEKAKSLNLASYSFEEKMTTFHFNEEGRLQSSASFLTALEAALQAFIAPLSPPLLSKKA